MTFKIESNVPVLTASGGITRKYPFNEMKPGDSFLINGAKFENVRQAAIAFGRAYNRGWKFSTRKTPEGYRCWRIK